MDYVKPQFKYIKLKDKSIVNISGYLIDTEQGVFVNLATGHKINLVDAIAGKKYKKELL